MSQPTMSRLRIAENARIWRKNRSLLSKTLRKFDKKLFKIEAGDILSLIDICEDVSSVVSYQGEALSCHQRELTVEAALRS